MTNNLLKTFIFLLGLGCSQKTVEQGSFVISNVNIVDVEAGVVVPNKDVLVENSRIKKILPNGEVNFSDNTKLIDATNRYLIPGMWDMHAHPDDPEIWRMEPKDEEKDKLLTLLVVHGVTGIRDMAGDIQLAKRWKKLIADKKLIGPKIFAGGPLIDGPNPMWDGSVGINGPDNVKQVVDSLISEGVDFLKVYSLLPVDIYFELQRYANEINFPVAGHVPYGVTPTESANAGIKSQEHFLEITKEVSTMAAAIKEDKIVYGEAKTRREKYIVKNQLLVDTYDEQKAEALYQTMAKNETWHTPTISMWYKNAWFESEIKDDSALYKFLPPCMRRYWQIGENDHLQNRNEAIIKLKQNQVELYRKMLLAMYNAGVPLMTGTDMGANPLCFPGIGVHNELEMFVACGIPAIDALRAATIGPAKYLEIENDYGSVAEGKIADMVILEENPLVDINAVRKIVAVSSNGLLIDGIRIDEILQSIEKEFAE